MALFNKLKGESSPYLQQHADNPVNWYPWGSEAFAEAEMRNVPIFLSIGYSTCHWCHVMEKESFTDQEVADILNKYFVAVKVDREERPDIDQLYMDVCKAMTGSGGWPLSIFMTPDKKPFYASTYIPKKDKYGRKGLLSILPEIHDLWLNSKDRVLASSENVINHLKKKQNNSEAEIEKEVINDTLNILDKIYDKKYAGFGNEPKFPMPQYLSFLMQQWKLTSNDKYLEMVKETLHSMRAGGIFDQLGGGFHRYSTDRKWNLPHFEKMLYDQALLIYSYSEAYQITNKEIYLDTINKTVNYLKRDMMAENGCFYSAEDADSEGVEGKYYFWNKKEIKEILSEKEYKSFQNVFNLQRQNKINLNLKDAENYNEIAAIKAKLLKAREKRVRPDKDKKILTDWNGLMIAALAKAGSVIGNEEYISLAEKTAEFLFNNMRDESGKLGHSYFDGSTSDIDNLNDYASLLWGFVELYQATLKNEYLIEAEKITKTMIDNFWDESSGGFYFTSNENKELFIRQKKAGDSAIPSANSIAAYNLLKLAHLLDNYDLREKVEQILNSFAGEINSASANHIFLLLAYQYLEDPFKEINIYGSLDSPKVIKLMDYMQKNYLPGTLLNFNPSEKESEFSICKNFVCGEKTEAISDIISEL